ncbi:MAG TPA: hypothetical protein VKA94_04105 [Hyphomicrobiales bacterium]|nr:hypothetical protein [Hyphomicrobiales bacterium]
MNQETTSGEAGRLLPGAPGSAHDHNTQIIREECERRIEVCRVNILEAGFAIRHMNPRRAAEMLQQCEKYANLASLDAEDLTRRLNAPNSLLDEPKSPSDPLDPIHKEKGSHSVKYCGRWVFERPNNQSEMTYLVRTPEGRTFLDHGTGQANVLGQIVAWLEMFPEPPISPLNFPKKK